jgi:adenosylmethionine-8-amino-7-oxononanoate aminotransferase
MHWLAALDHQFVWHPFTQMRDWLKREPIVIVRGQGAEIHDAHGKRYLDANSSIWTNLHGHNHPAINKAIRAQLKLIAHSSALGLANEPGPVLARELVCLANRPFGTAGLKWRRSPLPDSIAHRALTKVFFSDNGSTALEVALKLAFEFCRRTSMTRRPRFVSIEGAYHGDTVGAVSLGHIELFHKAYSPLLFKTDTIMAPYCYRCPFNRAKPERADAREYRKCNWECIGRVEQKFASSKRKGVPYSVFVFEPLIQGAAGMIPQPNDWLRRVADIARGHGALLVADEVMTGFGRTGASLKSGSGLLAEASQQGKHHHHDEGAGALSTSQLGMRQLEPALFACHREGVQPDFLALAKGLTGGYVPMAATLTTQAVFDAFLGEYEEFKTFFHGHSFTGNQIGAAASLASLSLLQSPRCIAARSQLEHALHDQISTLWDLPYIGDIRQVGLIAGIELVKDWRTRQPFDLRKRAGIRVCEEMARRGVLTRPVGNVIVLMPPYCTTPNQLRRMVTVLGESIRKELQ